MAGFVRGLGSGGLPCSNRDAPPISGPARPAIYVGGAGDTVVLQQISATPRFSRRITRTSGSPTEDSSCQLSGLRTRMSVGCTKAADFEEFATFCATRSPAFGATREH